MQGEKEHISEEKHKSGESRLWHKWMLHATAGTCAGFMGELLVVPLESGQKVWRVALASDQSTFFARKSGCLRIGKQLLDLRMLAHEAKVVAINHAPITGITIGLYEVLYSIYMPQYQNNPILVSLLAGFVAEAVSGAIWNPVIVLRHDMHQSGHHHALHTFADVRDELRKFRRRYLHNYRFLRLYKGYFDSLAKGGPFVGCYFASTTWLSEKVTERTQVDHDDFPISWAVGIGAGAAVITVVLTTPTEFIRQFVQTEWKYRKDTKASFQGGGWNSAAKSVLSRWTQDFEHRLYTAVPYSVVKKATYGMVRNSLRSFLKTFLRNLKRLKI